MRIVLYANHFIGYGSQTRERDVRTVTFLILNPTDAIKKRGLQQRIVAEAQSIHREFPSRPLDDLTGEAKQRYKARTKAYKARVVPLDGQYDEITGPTVSFLLPSERYRFDDIVDKVPVQDILEGEIRRREIGLNFAGLENRDLLGNGRRSRYWKYTDKSTVPVLQN